LSRDRRQAPLDDFAAVEVHDDDGHGRPLRRHPADRNDYDPPMPRPTLPVPTWALLGALLVVSFALRFYWAVRDPAPWIFSDEVQYWEPAEAIADTGRAAIRGVPGTGGFGLFYPVLIAPAFLLFERLPDAYGAVKAINSLLMSLTALPVFLLARRFAGRGLALAAAALSVAIPAMTFTGNVMTENAFYPLTAFWLLALVRALERPTPLRQVVVVGVILPAILTKVQAVTFIPAMVASIAIVVLLDALEPGRVSALRRIGSGLVRFWPTWTLFALAVPVAIVRQAVRDQPMRELLGAYNAVLDTDYPVDELAQWALWHVAALDIFVGVLPFAAFILMTLWGLRPTAPREFRILSAVGFATVLSFLLVIAAFATTPTVQRILERNLFHVIPLFFVALVAWIGRGAPRPWWAVAPAALFAGTLTLALPINTFLNAIAIHSTPGLLPLWRWRDRSLSLESIDDVVAMTAVAAAALFVALPRRFLAPVALGLLALYFAAAARPVESFTHTASTDAYNTIRSPRDWIDRSVGIDGDVASLYWAGDQFRFWEAEFFNHSVGSLYSVPGPYDGLPGLADAEVEPSGVVRDVVGTIARAGYAVTDVDTKLVGKVVASQATLTLYQTPGRVTVQQRVDGLYADRWAGSPVYYQRFSCAGGTVVAHLRNDAPRLHPQGVPVTATVEERRQYTTSVPPNTSVVFRVPLQPKDGVCLVTYTMPTASPAEVYGSEVLRMLSVRMRFTY
jgi:hypothetical protein